MSINKEQTRTIVPEEQIVLAMQAVGLSPGDTVFVHADLKQFGYIKDFRGCFALALHPSALYNAFLSVLGDSGTLAVPTFSYSWPQKSVFCVQKTSSLMGTFSEYVRETHSALRSHHPLLSITAVGKRATEIIHDIDKSGFGANSPYKRLHDLNAKFVMVGVPFCSFKDYVEVKCEVPFRYTKYFRGVIQDDGATFEEIYEHSVRYLNRGVEAVPFYDGLSDREKELVRSAKFGSGFLRCIDSQTAYHLVRGKLETNPFAFIEKEPFDAHCMLLIHRMIASSRSPESGVSLNAFAIDENGVEKWVWSISNSDVLGGEVMMCIRQSAPIDADAWWLKMVPNNTEIVLSVGTARQSGADVALSTMSTISSEDYSKSIAALKEEFISALCGNEPKVYEHRCM